MLSKVALSFVLWLHLSPSKNPHKYLLKTSKMYRLKINSASVYGPSLKLFAIWKCYVEDELSSSLSFLLALWSMLVAFLYWLWV